MNEKVARDLTQSASLFKHIVYPEIKTWLGDGDLVPVEEVTDEEMTRALDYTAGIDGWYVETRRGVRGIASRVQYDQDWGTFTVRFARASGTRTEYEKLCHAVKNNWLYPYYFSQAYIELPEDFDHKLFDYEQDSEQVTLLNVGLCKTEELLTYIKNGSSPVDWFYRATYDYGAAKFIVVPWKQYSKASYYLKVRDMAVLDESQEHVVEPLLEENTPREAGK